MKLTEITIDVSLQARSKLNQEVIDEYAEALREGGKFPAVKVFRIGSRYYLVDGWHRYYAHKKAGLADIQVDIIDGDMRQAMLYAIGANDDHGLRRTNDDKRKAIMMLLDDVEWSEWSDTEVAKAARVSYMTVSRIRQALGLKKEEVKFNRLGKEVKVKTENLGKKKDEYQNLETEINITDEIQEIVEENEDLKRRLAVASMEATDEEKRMAEDQLMEGASRIKTQDAEIHALKVSRDTFMNQVADLKDQVKYWKRRSEKAEAKLEEFKKMGIVV